MKKIILFLLILFAFYKSPSVNAQLRVYSSGVYTFGNLTSADRYSGLFNGWLYQFQGGSSSYLRLEVDSYNPRISGSYDNVAFYDLDSGKYNDLQTGTIYYGSDRKMKTDIRAVDSALPLIKELRPVSFNWVATSDPNKNHKRMLNGVELKETGFVAQDVEKILPGAVITDEEGNKLLNYNAILPILTQAIQDLQNQVDSLKAVLKASKGR